MTEPTWKVALVTGASSGIGDAICRRLAAAGTDLVIVARDVDRLKALAQHCETTNRVTVEILPADLANAAERSAVEQRLASDDAPVDLLVNNAGFGTTGLFHELPIAEEERQIEVNVVALVRLSHAAIPGMIQRRRGAILNVSSLASQQPGPRYATYSATKMFVTSFSEAIHEELRDTGVTVTTVLPGLTRTEFQERAAIQRDRGLYAILPWMSADQVASEALAATARGHAICVPGMTYKVAGAVVQSLPRWMKRRAAGIVVRRSH